MFDTCIKMSSILLYFALTILASHDSVNEIRASHPVVDTDTCWLFAMGGGFESRLVYFHFIAPHVVQFSLPLLKQKRGLNPTVSVLPSVYLTHSI